MGLMELLEDQESHQLELLQLIHERFPPNDIPLTPGAEETPAHRLQFVRLSYSNDYVCSVSPLGFLLLEEVEGPHRLADGDIERILVDPLEEPLMSVLSSRAASQEKEQVDWVKTGTVRCNNDQDVVAFSTLVANSRKIGWKWDTLKVGGDVGAEGWAELARAVRTIVRDDDVLLSDGFNVSASRKAMGEGRTEDLRSIWEDSGLDDEYLDPMDIYTWSVESQGGHIEWTYGAEWDRLEEILGMTEEEWCRSIEQELGV